MKPYCIKQEEPQANLKACVPRPIPYYSSYNVQSVQKEMAVIHKFLRTLNILQRAQMKLQDSPRYPFVLQFSCSEFIVHLGEQKMDFIINGQMKPGSSPQPKTNSIPKLSSPTPTIKLPIYKKQKMNVLQDQKDTKNIPKNYCKAIITFACKNQALCLEILQDQLKVVKFIEKITQYKKQLLNIRIFSGLLQNSNDAEEEEFRKTFRILSRIFIKKHAINYIFNSKIVQHNWHLRYRNQIYKGVKSPNNFSHIKNL